MNLHPYTVFIMSFSFIHPSQNSIAILRIKFMKKHFFSLCLFYHLLKYTRDIEDRVKRWMEKNHALHIHFNFHDHKLLNCKFANRFLSILWILCMAKSYFSWLDVHYFIWCLRDFGLVDFWRFIDAFLKKLLKLNFFEKNHFQKFNGFLKFKKIWFKFDFFKS